MSSQSSDHQRPISRRRFLKQSAAASTVAAVGGGVSRCFAQSKKPLGANDRIRLGLIGCGGLGYNHHIPTLCGGLGYNHHIPTLMELSKDPKLNVELAAVCDIYEPRKQRARQRSGAKLFHDYREMLDRKDIHGVVIVTPDHWHAKMAIDAMEAGKDIHVEKPMTLYWEQAKAVYETSARLKRVVQVGAEGTSNDLYWQARRLMDAKAIGKLVWATGGVYRNNPSGDWNWPIDPDCSLKNLDWDAFLGPAPKRAFEPERYFRYRKFWDYSGGLAHDLIAHVLSALQTCIGPEFPTRINAAGGTYVHHDRETPDTFSMQVEYPSQYLATLFCTQTTQQGPEMAIRGEKGTIRFDRDHGKLVRLSMTPEEPFAKEIKPITLEPQPRVNHDQNFIECMRTRNETHCTALTGYKIMVALALAVRGYREGKTFTFDPIRQEIV